MTGRLRRQPLKISLPNRNRNIIKAAQPQNPTVAYNGPTPRGGLDYSRPRRPRRQQRDKSRPDGHAMGADGPPDRVVDFAHLSVWASPVPLRWTSCSLWA